MLNINENLNRLYLGIQGENKAKTITIDVSPWLDEYPNGTIYLWHQRNGEDIEYQPAYVTVDTEKKLLKWQPSSLDTFYSGSGRCGIVISEGEVIKKQKDIYTYVTETGSVNPGTPQGLASYNNLDDKPQINSVELKGNKSFADLGMFDDTLTLDTKAISAKKASDTFIRKDCTWDEM